MRAKAELSPRGKDSPLVSIVSPSFNQGAYIERMIRSVQRQTYHSIEHIIVDGGSTDSTPEVLQRYEGSLQWSSEPDNGMYDAINKGFRRSRGDILAYLNTDDEYLPWTVETAVETFRRCPEVGLVIGDAVYIDEESGRGVPRFSPRFDLGMIRRTSLICQPTAFWRRDVHDTLGGFDDSLCFVGDCDFWMRAGEHYPVAKIDEILAIDAVRPDALRSRQARPLWLEREQVRARYGPRRGLRYLLMFLWDASRHMAQSQYAFSRFTLDVALLRLGLPRLASGRWRRFLAAQDLFSLSLPYLLLGNIPWRARPLGRGAVRRADRAVVTG